MADIEEELGEGDIHLRDKFQFELKSEYCPTPGRANNTYSLEFFFFIPISLRINKQTYSKKHFYYDQTGLIRLKTPNVSLRELVTSTQSISPLYRIRALYEQTKELREKEVLVELKLYANCVRSALRDRSKQLLDSIKHQSPLVTPETVFRGIDQLCQEIRAVRTSYLDFLAEMEPKWKGERLEYYGQYIDEFLSITVQTHLTPLLQELQYTNHHSHIPGASQTLATLKSCIVWESEHRDRTEEHSPFAQNSEKSMEYFVYRTSLLKKFVWEVLFLNIIRKEPSKPFLEIAAVFAAGLAMLFYVFFLTWQGGGVIINSTTFIMMAVLLYIIKDRLKDGIKNLSATFATRWFPDYSTDIQTPDGETRLGIMKEFFSFVEPDEVPVQIIRIRNTGFHTELERAERIEHIFYYRKDVTLFSGPEDEYNGQHRELNDIFRYNISRFLLKASDAYKEHIHVDPKTGELSVSRVPKVYHINIIMQRSYLDADGRAASDLRKFRLVLDKEGIKRIEKVI